MNARKKVPIGHAESAETPEQQLRRLLNNRPNHDSSEDHFVAEVNLFLERICNQYTEDLEKFADSIGASNCSEVTSDAFTKFFQRFFESRTPTGKDAPASIQAYLKKIIRNQLADRSRRCQTGGEDSSAIDNDDQQTFDDSDSILRDKLILYSLIWKVLKGQPTLLEQALIEYGFDPRGQIPRKSNGLLKLADIANATGATTDTVSRRRAKIKGKIAGLITKIGHVIEHSGLETAFDEMIRKRCPDTDVHPSCIRLPSIELTVKLIEHIDLTGNLTIIELINAAAALDHAGHPDEAAKIVDRAFEKFDDSPQLDSEIKAIVRIEFAKVLDHTAALQEQNEEFAQAEASLENALKCVVKALDHAKPFSTHHCRARYQMGVLKRRLYEVKLAICNRVGKNSPSGQDLDRLLCEARRYFNETLLFSDRFDRRISTIHQISTLDLLAGNLDSAEHGFELCLDAWQKAPEFHRDKAPSEWNYRQAFEHRRLAHVHCQRAQHQQPPSASKHWKEAVKEFKRALDVVVEFRFMRYTRELQHDWGILLPDPCRATLANYMQTIEL